MRGLAFVHSRIHKQTISQPCRPAPPPSASSAIISGRGLQPGSLCTVCASAPTPAPPRYLHAPRRQQQLTTCRESAAGPRGGALGRAPGLRAHLVLQLVHLQVDDLYLFVPFHVSACAGQPCGGRMQEPDCDQLVKAKPGGFTRARHTGRLWMRGSGTSPMMRRPLAPVWSRHSIMSR